MGFITKSPDPSEDREKVSLYFAILSPGAVFSPEMNVLARTLFQNKPFCMYFEYIILYIYFITYYYIYRILYLLLKRYHT
jgi:hypothetical protein